MATKAQLFQTAKEFNELMQLDPPIKTGLKRTVSQLEDNIKEAAQELRDDDEFSDEVEGVLIELGIREKAEEQASGEDEPQTEEEEEKEVKPSSKPAQKSNGRYTRIMSVCDALSESGLDVDPGNCATEANKLYVKKAEGADNEAESLWATKTVLQVIAGLQKFKVKI